MLLTSVVLLLAAFTAVPQSRDDLIDPFEKPKLIADGFVFAEGPASDGEGNIYFTDIQTSRIYIWTEKSELRLFREPSGRTNGLRFDSRGNLLACEGASRRVTSTSRNGSITILANQYQGKRLNSPNDLWIDPEGGIYFTDPRYSAKWIWIERSEFSDHVPDTLFYKEEQEVRGVYYLPPGGKPLRRVAENFMNPNGVTGTSDGRKLYVSDTEKKETYVFEIQKDGSLTNRQVFIAEYSDGMTLDEMGNVYLTNGGIDIFTPQRELITTIDLPTKSSNVCFGGRDHKTLYITARNCVYTLRMKVSGQ